MSLLYQKIILPARPQPDTIVGIFLLKNFGKEKYKGIEHASVEVLASLPKEENEESLSQKGMFLIDVGKGKFDHHAQGKTASRLIAEDLGIADNPVFAKLLAYTQRDDKYGKGTVSQDPLDKAFGLSGLIAALNKTLPQSPNEVVEYILPLLAGHYIEEKKRVEDLPKEFKEKLQSGKAQEFQTKHKGKNISVAVIQSDNPSMAGWLRSASGVKADVVMQKTESGYVNILTRPLKRIDLREVASLIREEEARKRGIQIQTTDLTIPGRIMEIPDWYYDRATNSLLNGGTNPQGVFPTQIPYAQIIELLHKGLTK